MNHHKQSKIANVIAALFIFLFLYAALSKLLDYTAFRAVLSESPLIGSSAPVAALVIPVAEMAIACLLFFSRSRGLGMAASLLLMFLFTAYLLYMLAFEPRLPCSCGGVIQQMPWAAHLAFNAAFTGLAFWGVLLSNPKPVQSVLHFFTKPPAFKRIAQ